MIKENTVVIAGRLGAEPELRQAGTAYVCNFALAVDRMYSKEKVTDWIDCVAWSHNAEFLSKYGHKGDIICVRGELNSRVWEDKEQKKHKVVEVKADRLSIQNKNFTTDNGLPAPVEQQYNEVNEEDPQLPF